MRFLSFLLAALPLAAQQETAWDSRPGWLLDNGRLELVVLRQGGHLASLILKDDPGRTNPMWEPARMARELGNANPSVGGTGHFVCVDGFGGVSPEEQAAGLMFHGEASKRTLDVVFAGKEGNSSKLSLRTTLPLAQEVFTRTMKMVDGEQVVYVDTDLESLVAVDRPVVWAEHATVGSPFLAPLRTVVDLSAAQCQTRPHPAGKPAPRRLASGRDFTWPMAPLAGGTLADLRAVPASPDSMDHTTCRMDPSSPHAWVTALNLDSRLLIGYLFRREEFPWLQNWMNYPRTLKLARGIEFSTQPYDVPRREAVDMGRLFSTPTFRWLPAKSRIGARFLIFYTRVPEGFSRVDSVALAGGKLVLEDRKAGQRVELAASGGL